MTKAEEYFSELIREIPDVKAGKMFGALCIKTPNGKAGAMFWKDCLVVKLNNQSFTDAMSLDGSLLFEPMKGRPMKEWVQIPFNYKDRWKEFALISISNVRDLKNS
jgi:hypothetical protein